ncbi:MAG TPA: cyanophycin synthetase [Rubricoccaceae bacterium]|nr:cyanophycin synthetase [Rubricoccaceae bacterium]
MTVESVRALRGPNVYHPRPVLVARLDLGDLAGVESTAVGGFADRLLARLPGLHDHHCSPGRPGGFVERLREGTYFGHVVEHVALELSELAGIGVTFGKARHAGREGRYDVVLRYRSEAGMRHLVQVAVDLVDALVRGDDFPLEEAVEEAKAVVRRSELGPSTRALVEAAERRGIPWERVGEESLVRLGYGKHRRFVRAAMTSATSAIATDVAHYKDLTKQLLRDAFVPVPSGVVVRDEEAAVAAHAQFDGPVVVKPLDGNQGRGVTVGLTTPGEVREAFRRAAAYGRSVVVEEQLTGKDYRVLVVAGRVVAAAERSPCHVTGDGAHTIAELIEQANADPRRGEGHEKPLTRIVVDEAMEAFLARSGRTLADVPAAGECVALTGSANLSTGGTARDVTDALHPEVRAVCERAARAVGLDVCGVDLVTEDVARPLVKGRGGVIEVNASPGLRMHLHPSEGARREVAEAILDALYPPGAPSRIPIVAVTGTNGKTTTARLIGHVLGANGRTVGMTTTSGVWVGGTCVARGDLTGPASARAVLADPAVEVAVLETARGGILRRGLGYDWADVAVVTNVCADHLGQDGLETVDDLIHVKAVVAERVREGGTVVVNADDEGALRVLERVPREGGREVVLFSLRADHPLVRRHVAAGGAAYFVRDGWIVEACPETEARVLQVDRVPITFGGHAEHNVANVLGAVAACRALGLRLFAVTRALRAFGAAHNEGRASVYRLGRGHVVLDYGHNAHGIEAVGRFLRRWRPDAEIIGLVKVPGDRADALLIEAGRTAARAFGHLVLSEDRDLRGRAPGEVIALLRRGAEDAAPGVPVEVVPDEREALRSVLDRVRAGALAVCFYEELEPLVALLREADARPEEPRPRRAVEAPPAAGTTGDGAATTFAPALPAAWPAAPPPPRGFPAPGATPEAMGYGAG